MKQKIFIILIILITAMYYYRSNIEDLINYLTLQHLYERELYESCYRENGTVYEKPKGNYVRCVK